MQRRGEAEAGADEMQAAAAAVFSKKKCPTQAKA